MTEYVPSIWIFVEHLEETSVFMEIMSYYIERHMGRKDDVNIAFWRLMEDSGENRYHCPRQIWVVKSVVVRTHKFRLQRSQRKRRGGGILKHELDEFWFSRMDVESLPCFITPTACGWPWGLVRPEGALKTMSKFLLEERTQVAENNSQMWGRDCVLLLFVCIWNILPCSEGGFLWNSHLWDSCLYFTSGLFLFFLILFSRAKNCFVN